MTSAKNVNTSLRLRSEAWNVVYRFLRQWPLMLLVSALGTAGGVYYGQRYRPTYQSTAQVRVGEELDSRTVPGQRDDAGDMGDLPDTLAARREKVRSRIRPGSAPWATRWATRCARVLVFPDPAPAMISSARESVASPEGSAGRPMPKVAATRCAALSRASGSATGGGVRSAGSIMALPVAPAGADWVEGAADASVGRVRLPEPF